VLRRFKIDELPQLWNVLKGEMSLVGPRPELPSFVSGYNARQRAVLGVRPGITDAASIIYRNEEELLSDAADPERFYNDVVLPSKLALNLRYIDEISFVRDVCLLLQTLTSLPAFILRRRSWLIAVAQAILTSLTLCFAWFLRFDLALPYQSLLFSAIPLLVVLRMFAFARFDLLHGWWVYTGFSDLLDIVKAVCSSTIVFWLLMVYGFRNVAFPRSIYILEPILAIILLVGVRLTSRALAESVHSDNRKNIVLIGSGVSAEAAIRHSSRAESGYKVIACIDRNPAKVGLRIHGIPIVGGTDKIPILCSIQTIHEAWMLEPSTPPDQIKAISRLCSQHGLGFRTHLMKFDLSLSEEA
jgi:hypothetical protein